MFADLAKDSAHRCALTVALTFALLGAAWVLVTDILLYRIATDSVLLARIETAKGWAFVAVTSLLLYWVTRRSTVRIWRMRELLSAIIDSIADGVLLLGPGRRIQSANPAAENILGSDQLVGMDAETFAHAFRVSRLDGSRVRPQEFVSQRAFDEMCRLSYKALIYPPGRSELVVSVTAAPVSQAAADDRKMVVSVLHDITAAERFERLRDDFFAAAAHALKTPVTIIKMNTQALFEEDPALREQSASVIMRQCERFERLIQNLLVIGRIRSGTLELHEEELELPDLLEDVVRKARAVFVRDIRSDLGDAPRVCVDAERLGLAVYNLIDEAVHFGRQDAPLTVTAARRNGNAEIRIGYSAASASAAPASGNGGAAPPSTDVRNAELCLGQTVASTVIDAHAGAIRREAASDTAILITLPAREAPREAGR